MAHKIKDIYTFLDTLSPFASQEKWDNSGLNIGRFDGEFQHIVVCLELTIPLAQILEPHTLIITHHPLFFRPIQGFLSDRYPANIAEILIKKHCQLISLHTNFDKSHLNAYFTHNILDWMDFVPDESGFIMQGQIKPTPLDSLASSIQAKLNAPFVSFVGHGDSQEISKVYVVCGSGCSLLTQIPAHSQACFITGDVKHHGAMIAQSMGIALIDVGHYESEKLSLIHI